MDEAKPRWRPEVENFADLMETRLRANDHKGGWQWCAPHWLAKRLIGEVDELLLTLNPEPCARPQFYAAGRLLNTAGAELHQFSDGLHCTAMPQRVRDEAADVANFAMMLADWATRTNGGQ